MSRDPRETVADVIDMIDTAVAANKRLVLFCHGILRGEPRSECQHGYDRLDSVLQYVDSLHGVAVVDFRAPRSIRGARAGQDARLLTRGANKSVSP